MGPRTRRIRKPLTAHDATPAVGELPAAEPQRRGEPYDTRHEWLAASYVAVLLTIGTMWLTIGSATPRVYAPAGALGLFLFLVTFPWALRQSLGTRLPTATWFTSEAFLTIIGMLLLGAVGTILLVRSKTLPAVFPVLGYLLFTWRLWQMRRDVTHSGWQFLQQMAWVTLFTVCIGSMMLGTRFHHDPLFESTLVNGTANVDQLMHAAVCQMITTYGVPSTGLDGIPYFAYHYGSHAYFATLCPLLQQAPLEFYHVSFPIIFQPLVLFGILLFARVVYGPRSKYAFNGWSRLVLCNASCGLLAMFQPTVAYQRGWDTLFLGESNTVGICLLLLGAATFIQYLRQTQAEACSGASRISAVLFFPLLTALVNLVKVSIAPVILPAATYAMLRSSVYRTVANAVMLALASVAFLITLRYVIAGAPVSSSALALTTPLLPPRLIPLHLIMRYEFVLIYACLRLRDFFGRPLRDLGAAITQGRFLDLELLVVTAIVGSIPAILGIAGYNAKYFFDSQAVFGLALVVAWCARQSPTIPAASWSEITLSRLLKHSVFAYLLLSSVAIIARDVMPAVKADNLVSRGWTENPAGMTWTAFSERNRELTDATRARLDDPNGIFQVLRELSQLPVAEKRRSILFIPYSTTRYWNLLQFAPPPSPPEGICLLSQGMIAPAETGIAQLKGFPAKPIQITTPETYGAGIYSSRDLQGPRTLSESNPAELLAAAKALGFSQVIMIVQDAAGNVKWTPLN